MISGEGYRFTMTTRKARANKRRRRKVSPVRAVPQIAQGNDEKVLAP